MNQGGQSDDAAFTSVVRAKNENHVFETHDHDKRPEHQREDSQYVCIAHGYAVFTMETLSNSIYRAGTDISEDHA